MPNNATRFTAVLKLIYARAATSLSSWPQTWESAAFAILCGAVKATVLVDNFRLSPADSRGAGGRCCIGDDGELWCVQGKVELSGIYPPWGGLPYMTSAKFSDDPYSEQQEIVVPLIPLRCLADWWFYVINRLFIAILLPLASLCWCCIVWNNSKINKQASQ